MRYRHSTIIIEELRAIYRETAGGPLDAPSLLPAGSAYAISSNRHGPNIAAGAVTHRELFAYTSFADFDEARHG